MNTIRTLTKLFLFISFFFTTLIADAQKIKSKKISTDLFGVFFEDLNYAGDGGLYAELIQNRSFEYSLHENGNWGPFASWEYFRRRFAIGTVYVETNLPLHPNNPHYAVLTVDVPDNGIGFKNSGFDGIHLKAGETYDFSIFLRQITDQPISIQIQLVNEKDTVIAEAAFITKSKEWQKYTATLTPNQSADSGSLVILAKSKGKVAIDMVSLFPKNTFKKRVNGLRADLSQAIAELQPKFLRFPGGCLVHGDGVGNMYNWKNAIGPVEQRIEQRNIWDYHQSAGLGFYEYFQFCEDIHAKPLPVVPAGVSCNNSGQNWNEGQQCIALSDMGNYVQDVLDLIEYANGPETSKWGSKRAAAGHPRPFNLQYLGVGNEDKQTPEFRERFQLIYDAIKEKYPEIIVVGTVGGLSDGEDYEQGWKFARELHVPLIDEHYYKKPDWFLSNLKRYDSYSRTDPKVYIGEYGSLGNTFYNALCEAAYMISLERNGDVVSMASYAPLLSNDKHIQYPFNLIFFNNQTVCPSINYYVQQLFSSNAGDRYYNDIIKFEENDTSISTSCVTDQFTKDIILKIVNTGAHVASLKIDLSNFNLKYRRATVTVLKGDKGFINKIGDNKNILPEKSEIHLSKTKFLYPVEGYSFCIIRIKHP